MSRRDRNRVRVILRPGRQPNPQELDAILWGADALVARGGRSLLVKILRGSKAADIMEHKLQTCPGYGKLGDLSMEEVNALVDRAIEMGWVRIEYSRDLPMLVHSEKGWERTKHLWTERTIAKFEKWRDGGTPEKVWPDLENLNRQIKWMVLEQLAGHRREDLIPILEAWAAKDFKKVSAAIRRTISVIRGETRGAVIAAGEQEHGASFP